MKKYSYLDMIHTLLPENEFLAFTEWYRKPLQKSIHLRYGKEQLEKEGWIFTPPDFSRAGKRYDDVLFVAKADKQSLGSHPLHQAGAFYVQEMAAGLPAQMLNVQPWEIVLDLCAAPGGKSIQLADQKAGLLISNELNPIRRKALKANLERCGIWNTIVTGYDGRVLGNLLYEQCDKVLLDAPCSGEGMQYKSDVTIYQRNEKVIRKLAHMQYELLIAGLTALKIWGTLVYSTCTTNVLENEGVVARILEELGESVELVEVEVAEKSKGMVATSFNISDKVARFRPHIHHTGGFFIATFKKHTSFPHPAPSITNNKTQEKFYTEFKADSLWKGMVYLQTKHTIRATTPAALSFLETLYIDQVGLPIFKLLNDGSLKPLVGWEKLSKELL